MASYSTPPGLDFVSHCYRGLTPTAIHVEPHSGFGVLVCWCYVRGGQVFMFDVLMCWSVEVLMFCARCSGVHVRGGGRAASLFGHGSGFDH